jgi:hypothetical protein
MPALNGLSSNNSTGKTSQVKDPDHLLDSVARMTEYSETNLFKILKDLDSLNCRKQFKPLRKVPTELRPWNRPDCQTRRRLELQGLPPRRIAAKLGRPPYRKADASPYQCSRCTEVYLTWRAASDHWKNSHSGPIEIFCMSCGSQMPNRVEGRHEAFCGWSVLDTNVSNPSRIWLCCLQNLLQLRRGEVCDLIHKWTFESPSGHCNARGKQCQAMPCGYSCSNLTFTCNRSPGFLLLSTAAASF